jgi:hypothetical protein
MMQCTSFSFTLSQYSAANKNAIYITTGYQVHMVFRPSHHTVAKTYTICIATVCLQEYLDQFPCQPAVQKSDAGINEPHHTYMLPESGITTCYAIECSDFTALISAPGCFSAPVSDSLSILKAARPGSQIQPIASKSSGGTCTCN